jgi:hypothetical protein
MIYLHTEFQIRSFKGLLFIKPNVTYRLKRIKKTNYLFKKREFIIHKWLS